MGLVCIIRKESGGQNVRTAAFRGQSLVSWLERGDSTKLTPSSDFPKPWLSSEPPAELWMGSVALGKLPSLWLISPRKVETKDPSCTGFCED